MGKTIDAGRIALIFVQLFGEVMGQGGVSTALVWA